MEYRKYAVEVSDLLTRWKRGEDVQDAMAHKLRHLAAGLDTLQERTARYEELLRIAANNAHDADEGEESFELKIKQALA